MGSDEYYNDGRSSDTVGIVSRQVFGRPNRRNREEVPRSHPLVLPHPAVLKQGRRTVTLTPSQVAMAKKLKCTSG